MIEIDKMALELLAAEYDNAGYGDFLGGSLGEGEEIACRAIRAALLAAPSGWKLVPVQPTDEMIDSAEGAYMPFGDMHFAITSAILAAPEPKA